MNERWIVDTSAECEILELDYRSLEDDEPRTAKLEGRPGKISKCWREGRWYEHELLRHIQGVVQDLRLRGGIAVDGGANFGNHTLFFALACAFEEVYAFEPLQYDQLGRNLRLNGLGAPRVHLSTRALGCERGFATHKAKGTLRRVHNQGEGISGPPDVRVERLDDILEDRRREVTLLKLDVEDMEPAALLGARDIIASDRPVIFAECHDGQYRKQQAILAPFGYRSVGNTTSMRSSAPVVEWRPEKY